MFADSFGTSVVISETLPVVAVITSVTDSDTSPGEESVRDELGKGSLTKLQYIHLKIHSCWLCL